MSEFWKILLVFVLSYVAGSIPFGLLVVWIFNGKDIRSIESGRTGGTNAMRAAGFMAGILTAGLDVLKGVATGWIVSWLMPGTPWVSVVAALMAILGHNYSIFLIEEKIGGGIRLRGGAGGATAVGGAIALWPPSALIILPLAALVYVFVGYASVTTMSISIFAAIIFAVRAVQGSDPWVYVWYGIAALLIVLWALRPNLARLVAGNERVVGLRAYWKRRHEKETREKASAARPSQQRRPEHGI
ncbi:MAG TPA: glycerol-3-phosphate acyltransferase [Bellilinea sp.]|nr:glycerol-3-phosphate acyltransferase [Bellilinea sp.]